MMVEENAHLEGGSEVTLYTSVCPTIMLFGLLAHLQCLIDLQNTRANCDVYLIARFCAIPGDCQVTCIRM